MQDIIAFIQNHLFLVGGLIFVAGLLLISEIERLRSPFVMLSPQQVVESVNRNHALIVDLREPPLYKSGHITNAHNLPSSVFDPNKLPSFLHQKQQHPVILVCHDGRTSPQIAKKLHGLGYGQVFLLEGGLTMWQNAALPLVQ